MEAGRLLRQAPRERLPPDPRGLVEARSGHHERPGHCFVTRRLVDRICLAREQALVDLKAVAGQDNTVDDELVADGEHDDVVEHDVVLADLRIDTVAAHGRPCLAEDRQLREGASSTELLNDADGGIEDDDEAEQRVLDGRDQQHDDPERADQAVEPREGVRLDDVAEAATAGIGCDVHLAPGDPLGDLGRGEAADGIGRRTSRARGGHGARPSIRWRMTPSRSAQGQMTSSSSSSRSMAASATTAPATICADRPSDTPGNWARC